MKNTEVDKLKYEREYLAKGKKYIAGVDEVGRGPLAGPVVCCAVIMPLDEESIIEGIDDSKKLSAKKREKLSALILERAIDIRICRVEPQVIDEINILEATKKCMSESILGLNVKPEVVLIDALKIDCGGAEVCPIIKGDFLSYTIGCASIVAKVYRDRLMDEYDEIYPGYAFAKNKGYGTAEHIKAIKENGPCVLHRRTFIKNFWAEQENSEQKNT